ncbi:MAG TPA: NAD-dependent epimerase/dehydratase family protein [Polyangiaceae bacterium]|nr:NAD-dependent epimerase/dehydratase family protein [Polyangiaceae bacterium]
MDRLREGAVLVTGFAGRLGRRLVRRLHRTRKVVGLDRKSARGLPIDVEHEAFDPQRSGARQVFRRGDLGAIVHLGVVHDPRAKRSDTHANNLLAFQRVLEYAERFEIPKIVVLSSANTYGPRPENAQFLSESAPLLAGGRFSEMHGLVELDLLAQSTFWRLPGTETVILRPANILGTVRNAPSNYLRLPVVPTLMGFDPMVQAVHQDDVVTAIERALAPGVRGIFNVAGPPAVRLSRALELLGRRTMPVPYSLAKGGLSGLFLLGMSRFPAPELDFIRYVCMVDDGLARRTLGYEPAHDLRSTLDAVDEERWVGGAL